MEKKLAHLFFFAVMCRVETAYLVENSLPRLGAFYAGAKCILHNGIVREIDTYGVSSLFIILLSISQCQWVIDQLHGKKTSY